LKDHLNKGQVSQERGKGRTKQQTWCNSHDERPRSNSSQICAGISKRGLSRKELRVGSGL